MRPRASSARFPAELLEEVRLHTTITRMGGAASIGFGAEVEDTGLSLGQRVYHQVFGEGVVLNFEGRGQQCAGSRSTSTPRAASGWWCSTPTCRPCDWPSGE